MLLSVLDLSPIPSGSTARQALLDTIDLARHVEALGYHRFWLAEHHNLAALASSSPEILIAAVAAATTTLRVGAGGIMLPNHSPLKIAEVFRVLTALHPDRIDLGVGRAAGTDPKTALALRQAAELAGAERFPAQLEELMVYLTRENDPATRFGPIKAAPVGVAPPPLFLLGSGVEGARLAAEQGLGFAYAHHIAPEGMAEAMRTYREAFVPSGSKCAWPAPRSILAVSAMCARDEAHAEDLLRCIDVGALRFAQGYRDLPVASIEEARAYAFDPDEETLRQGTRGRHVVGVAREVATALRAMAAEAEADEIMVVSGIHDPADRRRSYTELASILLE